MAIRRPTLEAMGVPDGTVAADCWMQGLYPTLWGYLSDSRYEDGAPRVTATLMVLAEAGVVKVCVNDRDNDRSAWLSGRSVQEALEALETALSADRIDWRVRQPSRANGKPRK